jgi:hypothetical protein
VPGRQQGGPVPERALPHHHLQARQGLGEGIWLKLIVEYIINPTGIRHALLRDQRLLGPGHRGVHAGAGIVSILMIMNSIKFHILNYDGKNGT